MRLFPMVQRYKFESKSQLSEIIQNFIYGCFQWFKGTNLKANHNRYIGGMKVNMLFPMVQRYKFESKSQLGTASGKIGDGCFQWFKGTNLKANHNL